MADIAFRHTYKDILSPEQMEYMMEMMYSEKSLSEQMTQKGHIFLVDNGKAYASYRQDYRTEDGVEVFHLEKLYVLPAYQHTGLGSRLLATVVESIKESVHGPSRIELNVNRNNPSLGFYEHIGMKRVRSGDFPIGSGFYMNDHIMAMDI